MLTHIQEGAVEIVVFVFGKPLGHILDFAAVPIALSFDLRLRLVLRHKCTIDLFNLIFIQFLLICGLNMLLKDTDTSFTLFLQRSFRWEASILVKDFDYSFSVHRWPSNVVTTRPQHPPPLPPLAALKVCSRWLPLRSAAASAACIHQDVVSLAYLELRLHNLVILINCAREHICQDFRVIFLLWISQNLIVKEVTFVALAGGAFGVSLSDETGLGFEGVLSGFGIGVWAWVIVWLPLISHALVSLLLLNSLGAGPFEMFLLVISCWNWYGLSNHVQSCTLLILKRPHNILVVVVNTILEGLNQGPRKLIVAVKFVILGRVQGLCDLGSEFRHYSSIGNTPRLLGQIHSLFESRLPRHIVALDPKLGSITINLRLPAKLVFGMPVTILSGVICAVILPPLGSLHLNQEVVGCVRIEPQLLRFHDWFWN